MQRNVRTGRIAFRTLETLVAVAVEECHEREIWLCPLDGRTLTHSLLGRDRAREREREREEGQEAKPTNVSPKHAGDGLQGDDDQAETENIRDKGCIMEIDP